MDYNLTNPILYWYTVGLGGFIYRSEMVSHIYMYMNKMNINGKPISMCKKEFDKLSIKDYWKHQNSTPIVWVF